METAYAAAWRDEWCGDFGVYKVFRSRGKCLDYLTNLVFRRARMLGLEVLDLGGKPNDGRLPKMTRKHVRDQLGSGLDFTLALVFKGPCIPTEETTTFGVREVDVE